MNATTLESQRPANGTAMTVVKTTAEKFLINYAPQQLELIQRTYAKNATPEELQLFLYMSQTYGLDILTRKIWCVKYGNSPAQIFAGRDGFLEIAHGNPKFDGMETTCEAVDQEFTVKAFRYEGQQNNRQKVYFDKTFPNQIKATCKVWRKDMTRPFVVEVWEEEYSTGMDNWEKKRKTMTGKVAESQCLRKAFSISGFYAPEEVGGEHGPDIQTATVVEPEPVAAAASAPEDSEGEESKRLKFLRGKMNTALQACKDEKAFKKECSDFQRAQGKGIWQTLTGHDAVETFQSLAEIHRSRILAEVENKAILQTWTKRMTLCTLPDVFKDLEKEYLANPSIESGTNNDLINDKGAELGIEGYAKPEGAE